jgi:sugar phosphate isomerase/epimerase
MRIGFAVGSDQLVRYKRELFELDILELEDYLIPGFADRDTTELPRIKEMLRDYRGQLVISAPYIDLNPGSPERLNREATRKRFDQAQRFAVEIGASEIVFLSTFIPIINLSAYEEDWVSRSISFWKSYLEAVGPRITVSLGNTFEFHPDLLLRIIREVDQPNFRLTLDLGHYLVYGKELLSKWVDKIGKLISTVYVHSNSGEIDTHDEPFKGHLKKDNISTILQKVSGSTKFIIKTNRKDTIKESVAWLENSIS